MTKGAGVRKLCDAFPALAAGPALGRAAFVGTHYGATSIMTPTQTRELSSKFGNTIKCHQGWIGAFDTVEPAVGHLHNPHHPTFTMINQNTLVGAAGNILAFDDGVLLAMSVRTIDGQSALADLTSITGTDGEWSIVHFAWPEQKKKSLNKQNARLSETVAPWLKQIKQGNHSRRPEAPQGAARKFNIAPTVKKFAISRGYKVNRTLSGGGRTIADKTTANGNIVRLMADAGGFNWTEPGISLKFIGHGRELLIHDMLPNAPLKDQGGLVALLDASREKFDLIDKEVMPVIDHEWGEMPASIGETIINHELRGIVFKKSPAQG